MTIEEMRSKIMTYEKDKPYVFISYSKQDAALVYPVVLQLQSRGVNLWVDKNLEGTGGQSWQANAFDVISEFECKKILFFMSRNSFLSMPCCAELLYTLNDDIKLVHNDGIPVVPISVENEINLGKIIKLCETQNDYHSKIDETSYRNIIQNSLNIELKNLMSKMGNQGKILKSTIINKVKECVFNNDSEITVVNTDIDAILTNIPPECKNQNVINGGEEISKIKIDKDNKTIEVNSVTKKENSNVLSETDKSQIKTEYKQDEIEIDMAENERKFEQAKSNKEIFVKDNIAIMRREGQMTLPTALIKFLDIRGKDGKEYGNAVQAKFNSDFYDRLDTSDIEMKKIYDLATNKKVSVGPFTIGVAPNGCGAILSMDGCFLDVILPASVDVKPFDDYGITFAIYLTKENLKYYKFIGIFDHGEVITDGDKKIVRRKRVSDKLKWK